MIKHMRELLKVREAHIHSGDYELYPDRDPPNVGEWAEIATVKDDCCDGLLTKANADRLAACWNALAGIDDPKAFMRDMRELNRYGPNAARMNAIFEHLKNA